MSEHTPMPAERLVVLADGYLLGELDADQLAELERELKCSPAARALFATVTEQATAMSEVYGNATEQLVAVDDSETDDFLSILSALDTTEGVAPVDVTAEFARRVDAARRDVARRRDVAIKSSKRTLVLPPALVWSGLAAAIGLLVWLGWPNHETETDRITQQGGTEVPTVNPVVSHVAVIRNSIDARWAAGVRDNTQHLQVGSTVTLRAGLVEVVFGNGTTVILEGPVTFEPVGPDGLRLASGRLTASAPDRETAFHIVLPDMTVTNHGGNFGVAAQADVGSRAVAFAGEITVDTRATAGERGGAVTRLSSGSGAVVHAEGLEVVQGDTLSFIGRDEFEARASGALGDVYARWLALGYELQRDPDVVAYFVFDQDDAERGALVNHAAGGGPEGRLGNGAEIAAPRWTAGRFEQTRALRFGDAGNGRTYGVVVPDHDALDLDDEMTFAIWVRATTRTRFYGTLLSKRDVPPRRMNYQIAIQESWHQGGQELQFGAGEDTPLVPGFVYSPASGRLDTTDWIHIAYTTDGRTIRYYINGERVHSSRQPIQTQTNSADLLIGTSATGGGQSHFNSAVPFLGSISEVLIAKRAFTDPEIQDLFRRSGGGH